MWFWAATPSSVNSKVTKLCQREVKHQRNVCEIEQTVSRKKRRAADQISWYYYRVRAVGETFRGCWLNFSFICKPDQELKFIKLRRTDKNVRGVYREKVRNFGREFLRTFVGIAAQVKENSKVGSISRIDRTMTMKQQKYFYPICILYFLTFFFSPDDSPTFPLKVPNAFNAIACKPNLNLCFILEYRISLRVAKKEGTLLRFKTLKTHFLISFQSFNSLILQNFFTKEISLHVHFCFDNNLFCNSSICNCCKQYLVSSSSGIE